MFEPDFGLQVWTLLTFAGLLLLLAKFAFKPLKKILDDRERMIREAVEQAKRSEEEIKRTLQENERMLEEARAEANRIADEGRARAEEALRKAHEEARAETEVLLQRALANINQQVLKSMDDLKTTVADVAIRVAREVIKENLDERRHRALVDDFIEQLKRQHEHSRQAAR